MGEERKPFSERLREQVEREFEEAYATRLRSYEGMRDATSEFEVWGLIAPVGDVQAILYHKPCNSIIYVTLYIDVDFHCVRCNKRYQLANIYPLKIVEVK
jgi:hypothetical protein